MTTTSRDAQQRSAAAAVKAERALDKAAAMQEYEADELALRANTERLRALRLAKEAEDLANASKQPPVKKAAPTPALPDPAKKKAVKRVAAPKRAGAKPPQSS